MDIGGLFTLIFIGFLFGAAIIAGIVSMKKAAREVREARNGENGWTKTVATLMEVSAIEIRSKHGYKLRNDAKITVYAEPRPLNLIIEDVGHRLDTVYDGDEIDVVCKLCDDGSYRTMLDMPGALDAREKGYRQGFATVIVFGVVMILVMILVGILVVSS